MDADLAIASKRDVKTYAPRAISEDAVRRILDAGRLAGSARNRQPWQFLVVDDAGRRARLAEAVYAPENVRTAALVVAVISTGKGPASFDCGRAAQNMMLMAWNQEIGSSPNGIADPDTARRVLELAEGEEVVIVLSFGVPALGRAPSSRTPEEWSRAANRKPISELVRRL